MPLSTQSANLQGASAAGLLLDVSECLDGFIAGSLVVSSTLQIEGRGAADVGFVLPALFYTSGGLPSAAFDASSGRNLVSAVSGAGRINRVGGVNNASIKLPLSMQWGGVTSIPAALCRPRRQYTFEHLVRVTVAGTATVEIGWAQSNAGMIGGTDAAVMWVSDPAVAAGAWKARQRHVQNGGILDVFQSVALASAWHKLAHRYTEGPGPTLEWLIDDVPLAILSGDAAMPTQTAASNPFVPYQGVNTPAGTTVQLGPCRFVIREI